MTLNRIFPVFALLTGILATAQTQRVLGVVTQVDPAAKQLSVKNDQGDVYAIGVPDTAKVVKTAPGAKDLKDSQTISLSARTTSLVATARRSDCSLGSHPSTSRPYSLVRSVKVPSVLFISSGERQ